MESLYERAETSCHEQGVCEMDDILDDEDGVDKEFAEALSLTDVQLWLLSGELLEWMKKLSLQGHYAKAQTWCQESNKYSLQAILEHQEDFAKRVELKSAEAKRVRKKGAKKIVTKLKDK